MKLHLCGLFAVCAFVLTVRRDADVAASPDIIHIVPANSSHTLYLVGYSSQMSKPRISCVNSNYTNRTDGWVNRRLNYIYTKQGREDDSLIISTPFSIMVENSPLVFIMYVNYTRDPPRYIGRVREKYHLLYYDNDTMVLSNRKANTTKGERNCSLWVTEKYINITTETLLAKKIFDTNCANPEYISYWDNCTQHFQRQ
uniref:Putative group viii salivary lipocalin n=1 Tax=Rhipicephalus pulchellus TaxID=72859 RepID=L7MBU7_RHIPC